MLITKMFGLTAAAGLTLAFRSSTGALYLDWVGILCLIILSNRRKRGRVMN